MAHKYYCTNCARELNQDLVLLDLEPALTVSNDHRFNVLKFRVRKKDFDELLAGGTAGDLDFIHVDLPFASFARYLSDKNNLDDVVIKGLTLEDISEFLDDIRKDEFGTDDEPEDDMMGLFAPVGVVPDAPVDGEPEEKVWAPAIEALRSKNTTAKGEAKTDRDLIDDLSRIHTLFAATGSVHLAIKPQTEKADDGDDVLTGYLARSGAKQIPVEARVCCHCSTKVFKHAGTAEHRSVAFIGEPSSGKTSTILAMTHFAENAVRGGLSEDPIWGGTDKIPGIKYIDLLNASDALAYDLKLYTKGYAPAKTDAKSRDNAYSATLWVKNAADQSFILTLMDLPGELCLENGEIDGENILNNFPVALACDVFIICFDTTQAKGAEARKTNKKVCSWANEFQALRQSYKVSSIEGANEGPTQITSECFAPMMLLFTKCADLEKDREANVKRELPEKGYFEADQVKEIYSLREEREFINMNEVYADIGSLIVDYHNLTQSYFARLRSSPYGFAAPRYNPKADDQDGEKLAESEDEELETAIRPEIDDNDPSNKNPDGSIRYPRPIHIGELMNWLLTVSGYIPAESVYCENPLEPEHVYRPHDVYVTRAQYRVKEPYGKTKVEALNEAMSRAYLFENYSEMDQALIWKYEEIVSGKKLFGGKGTTKDSDNGGNLGGIFGKLFGGKKKGGK